MLNKMDPSLVARVEACWSSQVDNTL